MKKVFSVILALMLILPCFSGISVSAAEEVTGEIKGATLNIGSSLTIDYYATVSSGEPLMRFTTSNGRVINVLGVYDTSMKMYKFPYTGINPQCMTENVKAELIVDGNVLATKEEYSVKSYCDTMITKKASELNYTDQQLSAFRTLLADMLVYGGASQEYREYNTSMLANTGEWVKIFATTFQKPVGVREIEGNKDANNKVKSLGLNMSNVNKIYFKLILTDDVTVKLDGVTVDKKALKNDNGVYTLYTDDIKATEFDDVYTLTIEKDGNVISTVRYNVNAYIENMYAKGLADKITQALYNYGASAEKYIQAMKAQTEGGDFDLGEEDELESIENILPEHASTFETAATFQDTGWTFIGSMVTKELVEDDFGKCLHYVRTLSETAVDKYYSPMLDISKYIKHGGIYTVTFDYKVEGAIEESRAFDGVIRTSGETSFAQLSGSNCLVDLGGSKSAVNGKWETYTANFAVEDSDLEKTDTMPWNLGMHQFQEDMITDIYIDNFMIKENKFNFNADETEVNSAETWVSNELVLVSDKEYDDPFNDVDVDLILTNGTVTYTIPGFWDGNNIWRVRFICPTAGTWTYTTVCTDTTDAGLHNKTNTFTCTEYSGDLDIYKHGFVKTLPNTKHFVYNDGTPFFYLGDTHWSLGGETLDMVKEISAHRVSQGYNVWQSEPLGASFSFYNGINPMDIVGLRDFDEKCKVIADAGMVHANAQFFFPSEMSRLIANFGGYDKTKPYATTLTSGGTTFQFYDLSDEAKAYLEKISRYWVARYSSYPVMWTLGQEIDNDYYWSSTSHSDWSYVNNPYRYVAQYIYKYDPYKSPLSGHQEGHGSTVASDDNEFYSRGTKGSALRDLEAHTWYANQWKPHFANMNGQATAAAEDYWYNGQGKPVVCYEGKYCYLWTKNFGARAQGWFAYLSGMFGHGYGAQDTWCYLSTYSEADNTSDGVDLVTSAEKQEMTWRDALEFESSYQLGYMKNFFEDTVGDWWNLIPRFDDTAYLTRDSGALAYIASNSDSSKIVTYYYNFSDPTLAETPNSTEATAVVTGTYSNLQKNTTYKYKWFNPRTAEYSAEMTFTSSSTGTWSAPDKTTGDMVLYIYK